MADTKLKIDFTNGILEVEGNEKFVQLIYNDFKEKIQETQIVKPKVITKTQPPVSTKVKSRAPNGKKRKQKTGTTIPQIARDLDLTKKGSTPSLREFYGKYTPKSNQERNLVFCYYLKNIKKTDNVTVDHIFTCYRDIKGLKLPKALAQSLIDTSAHKGWINTSSLNDITIEIPGINQIEHDMSKEGEK